MPVLMRINNVRQRGMALMAVLWVTVILGMVVAACAYLTRIELRQAYYPLRDVQLAGVAAGAVEEVKAALFQDTGTFSTLGRNREIAANVCHDRGRIRLEITVDDEESRLNLNTCAIATLGRLPVFDGCASRETVLDSVQDWRDADNEPRPNGAEEAQYQRQDPLTHCKNNYFDTVDELNLVHGVRESGVLPALRELVSVVSNGKVNVNTAGEAVLAAVPGLDRTKAAAIIARRAGPDRLDGTEDDTPFGAESGLKEVLGDETYNAAFPFVTVRSANYRVRVTARYGKQVKCVEAVVQRTANSVITRYWREL